MSVGSLLRRLRRRFSIALMLCGALGLNAAAQETSSQAISASDEQGLTPIELLGKRIFEDKTLSRPAGVACASCHQAQQAYQGNNGSSIAAFARGAAPNTLGKRNTPTVMYASFSPPFSFVEERDVKTGHREMIPIGEIGRAHV